MPFNDGYSGCLGKLANRNIFKLGEPDTFRIKIWWEDVDAVEHVVYDNGFNQAIGGGSIVVHTSK